ncbi:MAG TPA: ribonuclease J, partial [Oligoflexia bacterium]|nr:ribonuclease J [Oligoflexia bacterium]
FKKAGDAGVVLLMSDSTNVERDGHSLSEVNIYRKFKELFAEPTGLTIVSVFASNIARIGQVMELADHFGHKVALLGRSMEQNVRLAQEAGYLEHARSVLIGVDEIEQFPRNKVIVLSTGSQGEFRSALARIASDEHRSVSVGPGDTVIMSSKFIPGNEKAIGRMINSLFKMGADVLYESVEDIHVSGHANADELRKMLRATRPRHFIPVHGEYRHLVKHARLAEQNGVAAENIVIAVNGDVLELTKNSLKRVDHFEENRIFIEGEGGNDISKVVIKDRRKVAEAGIVFSVLIRNSVSGKIVGGPDLISRGLFDGDDGLEILEKGKKTVLSILRDVERSEKQIDLQEEIRIGLRRFFAAHLGKKPVVLPILIDV